MKKISTFLYRTVFVLLICVFLFSAWMMYSELKGYNEDKKSYQELEEFVEVVHIDGVEDDKELTSSDDLIPKINFAGLLEINSDCIGWIYVPKTNVNYPVVQGNDNDVYLRRLFNKKSGASGTVFMDYRNAADLSDLHTILYGHHMKNGTMFADVEKYENQEYADGHPKGFFITPARVYEIEFFAGYQTDAYDECWELSFSSEDEYAEWLRQSKKASNFINDLMPSEDDHIMTLSTCSYDLEEGRFVLLGIITEIEQ